MGEVLEDFFSIEALKILEGFDGLPKPLSQSNGFPPSREASDQTQKTLTQPQRRKRRAPINIPGCATLNTEIDKFPKSKRRKFELKRRTEVAKVRKHGACIRCKQMKISVGTFSLSDTNATLTGFASVFLDIALRSLHP